ncbi:MAG TPA: TetR family transcriptional regulator [Sphingomonas sp.]|jgi:AcrR family transcriptional regulator|uniref:TetR/AcrR family transcriptional regulator n=1 Tax=Sphingomonas sp. TaxID=28214 RepID=UPI002ED8692E
MEPTPVSTRTRLTAADSKDAAIAAARALLIESGPQAVTLKAVAARIGKSHANLLHHFGSAAGLQSALAATMADRIILRIRDAVLQARAGEVDPRVIVDLTFDAFDVEGAGALASWMILSGDRRALDPIMDAIHAMVEAIGDQDGRPVKALTLSLVLTALGDALLGGPVSKALGLPRWTAREMAVIQLLAMSLHSGGDAEEEDGDRMID